MCTSYSEVFSHIVAFRMDATLSSWMNQLWYECHIDIYTQSFVIFRTWGISRTFFILACSDIFNNGNYNRLSLKRGFGRCRHGFGGYDGLGGLGGLSGLGGLGGLGGVSGLGKFGGFDGLSGFDGFGGFSEFDGFSGFGGFVF